MKPKTKTELVALLLEGVDLWNSWREGHGDVVNLTNANLTNANLTDAILTRANLTDANLTNANLTDADLTRANLTDANLTYADLTRANLTRADLTDVHLTDANLTDADLTDANLTRANLSRTRGLLSPAKFLGSFETTPTGIIAYKTFNETRDAPPNWKIEPGALLEETCNPCRTCDCGSGINVASLDWVVRRYAGQIWKLEVKWVDLAGAVVPYTTDGKFRVERATLLEKVARDAGT